MAQNRKFDSQTQLTHTGAIATRNIIELINYTNQSE